jgi:hypothetical protein
MAIEKVGTGVKVITKADLSRVRIFHLFNTATEIRFDIKRLYRTINKMLELIEKEQKDIDKGDEELTKEEIDEFIKFLDYSSKKYKEIENDKENLEFKESLNVKQLSNILFDFIKHFKKFHLTDGQKEKLIEIYNKFVEIIKKYIEVLGKQVEEERILELGKETLREKYLAHLNIKLEAREIRRETRDIRNNMSKESNTEVKISKDIKQVEKQIGKPTINHKQFEEEINKIENELNKFINFLKEDAHYFSQESTYFIAFLYRLIDLIEKEEEFIKKIENLGFNTNLGDEDINKLHEFLKSLREYIQELSAKDKYLRNDFIKTISEIQKEERMLRQAT